MKTWIQIAMMAMVSVAVSACRAPGEPESESDGDSDVSVADDDGAAANQDEANVGEAEQALSCGNGYIYHYNYSDGTGTYRWDVTRNDLNGRWYVDERRIGGGFYKQYSLTPTWTLFALYASVGFCPGDETVSLTSSGVTLTGPHHCLLDGREEVHLPDKQRVLVAQSPYITCL